METLLRVALSNAACGAALAALAFAVSRSIRRPALTHLLWVLALLKLLTPPLWTVGLAPAHPGFANIESNAAVQIHTTAALRQTAHEVSAQSYRDAPRFSQAASPRRWILPAGLIAWGAGSMACLTLTLARIRQFRRALRHASSEPGLQRRVDALAESIALARSPAAWLVPGRVCPMVWWTFGRPKLLLPLQLWSGLDDPKRDALILHELAHLKRRDHWVRVIELLATVVYWWNPLVWWARRELRIAEEQCCDAWVARAMPASGHVYAAALLDAIDFVSSSGSFSSPRLPALASGMGEFRHLQRRLVMIQQGTSIRPLGWTGFALICGAALVLPLSLSRGQSAAREQSGHRAHEELTSAAPTTRPAADDDSAAAALLNRVVPELQFDSVSLSDVVDFLRDVSGANIFVKWHTLDAAGVSKDAPITVRFRRVKFSKALDTVLEAAGDQARLGYYFDDNVLTITTADDASRMTVTHVYDVKDLLSPGDPKATTDELIRAITKSCAPDSWKDNGGGVGAVTSIGQMLVVLQTQENQRLVKDLLDKARKAKQESSGR